MEIKSIFLTLSIIIGLITPLIGIRSIFKGEYKPHRITRIVYLIINLILVASLFIVGDRVGIFLAILQLLSSLAIFLLSIKFGVGGFSVLDIVTFALAVLAIIIWRTTNNALIAIYMSIIADFIGFSPTLIKSFKKPFTEDPKFYLSDTIASFFNLLALSSFLFKDFAYPLYVFLLNFICLSILIYRRKSIRIMQ